MNESSLLRIQLIYTKKYNSLQQQFLELIIHLLIGGMLEKLVLSPKVSILIITNLSLL